MVSTVQARKGIIFGNHIIKSNQKKELAGIEPPLDPDGPMVE